MLYEKYAQAWDTKNVDMLESLCHPGDALFGHRCIQIRVHRACRTTYPKI